MSCTFHLLASRSDFHHGRLLLVLSRHLLFLRELSSVRQISRSLQESYRLLQLPDEGDSTPVQVKDAYLRLAKLYHPDSGAPTADAVLFARVEEAYRAVLAHQSKNKRHDEGKKVEDEDKARGTALPHRHYLSYEGVGSGTPSQRERQYRQIRVDRANEQVLDYRQREHERAAAAEGALVERDMRQRSRKIKITQAVERLVEDLIQESMARGDFRNLSGAGKPLNKFEYNPYADPMTHNLNRILIDNGYQPAWDCLQIEIKGNLKNLARGRCTGEKRRSNGLEAAVCKEGEQSCFQTGVSLKKLSLKVNKCSVILPLLHSQHVDMKADRQLAKPVCIFTFMHHLN
ncbi:DnaJ -like protein subfamily C member 28 [Collichthys lucidus]|uniref:DnaJ-like protein subfamily C member 28 n=1 Tax=Collichthys lucidus TaxID=240159 RepID=A0A4U5V3N5_COLLU|nr:DnaJ -like protein subfamily C member 28 [Collichthys lucidus]